MDKEKEHKCDCEGCKKADEQIEKAIEFIKDRNKLWVLVGVNQQINIDEGTKSLGVTEAVILSHITAPDPTQMITIIKGLKYVESDLSDAVFSVLTGYDLHQIVKKKDGSKTN